jgi:hypothetical protein
VWDDSSAGIQRWLAILRGTSLASVRAWISKALNQALGSSAGGESSKTGSTGGRNSSLSFHAGNHTTGAGLALSSTSLQVGSVGSLAMQFGLIGSRALSRGRHSLVLSNSSSSAAGERSMAVLLAAGEARLTLRVDTLKSTVILGADSINSVAHSTSSAHSSVLDHAISDTLLRG